MVSSSQKNMQMPPLTNIIRPYRCDGYIPKYVEAYFNSAEYPHSKK